MDKTTKRKVIIIASILAVIFIASFIVTICILKNTDLFSSYTTQINYTFDKNLSSELSDLESSCESLVSTGTDYNLFKTKYDRIGEIYKDYYSYYKIEYLNVCYIPYKDNYEKMEEYSDKVDEINDWYCEIHQAIYDSSFKDVFYQNISEHTSYVMRYEHTDEVEAKMTAADDIQEEYDNLSDSERQTRFYDYMAKLVKAKNEYAKALSYDNYFEYANDQIYKRDYDEEDLETFVSYVNTYINGYSGYYYKAYNKKYQSSSSTNQSPIRQTTVSSTITTTNISEITSANHSQYQSLISDFAATMGDAFNTNYQNLTTNKYIIESTDEDCYDGAFTTYIYLLNTPAMFLGNSTYQNAFTYIHELGHSYNYTKTNGVSTEFDLCETHSQGDEMLFLAYLLNQDDISNTDKNTIYNDRIENYTRMILYTTYIAELEAKLYTDTETMTANECYNVMNDVMKNEFNNPIFKNSTILSYAEDVMMDNPMYYASYATSLVASLSLLTTAISNYDAAVEKYEYINSYENYNGFIKTLAGAGIGSPFNESTYVSLSTLYN